jgi:serine/threonine protein kinase/Tol biopolymer transport system component
MEFRPGNRVSDLYHRALERTPDQRLAFLQEACDGDDALREEVESLLRYEPVTSRFLETPASAVAAGGPSMLNRQLGPYMIVAPLGVGGMGEVYRARDTKLGRDVAIKILPSHFTSDPERRTRFAREARLLATLNHPHIGAIYGLEESNGLSALVLELVDGPTLEKRLEGGPLKLAEALTVARQVADALEAAHEKGIVHRDLKPANIVLQRESGPSGNVRAKVLDFGLAKTLARPGDAEAAISQTDLSTSTVDGRILGTPAYMSPEQARGQPVDKRTDIWAFGCVLYEMLTGRHAFGGETMSDTFVHILEREPDWTVLPARTPRSIQTLIQRCLQKEPQKRLHDIADARLELDECAATASSTAGVPRIVRRRRSAIVVASTAIALLAVVGVAWIFWPVPQATQQPSTPRRLTVEPGLETDPTFSPDGLYFAYASNKSGNFDIYMQPVAGGNAVQVTSDPAHDTQPDWSPHTDRIVFRSERDGGGLFVAPSTGGRADPLTTFGSRPRWSPDGTRILFAESALAGGRAYTVRLDGTPPKPINTDGLNQAGDVGLGGWLDSQRVSFLFSAGMGAPVQLTTVDVTRGTIQRSEVRPHVQAGFRDQPLLAVLGQPIAWAPDATAVYLVGISGGLFNIWSLDVDPRTLAITGGPHRMTAMRETNEGIAVSRTGTGIAFGAVDRNPRILSYPLDASGRRIVGSPDALTKPDVFASSPDLTPDGSRVLYRVGLTGRGGELHVVIGNGPEWTARVDDFVGRRETRFAPRWSPDGTRITYRHIRPERADPASEPVLVRSLELLDVETGKESVLTTPFSEPKYGDEVAYGWSPDGQFVVSTSGRYKPGEMAIALVPVSAAPKAEDQARIVTTSAEYKLWNAGMSVNARWICFNAVKGAASGLAVVDSKGGPWRWLTDGRFWVDQPRWSPDGRLIYFISREGGLFNVWAIAFDPDRGKPIGERFQVTRFDGSGEQLPSNAGIPELGVGGGRLVIPVINPTGGIWMLENLRR